MTTEEAIEILYDERGKVEVDTGAFADPPAATGVYVHAEVRFNKNKWGMVDSGWVDMQAETIFITPDGGEGRYVPVAYLRREETSSAA